MGDGGGGCCMLLRGCYCGCHLFVLSTGSKQGTKKKHKGLVVVVVQKEMVHFSRLFYVLMESNRATRNRK